MPAFKYDMTIAQGATEGLTFQIFDPTGTIQRDLTGYTAKMQIRKHATDATAIWSGTSSPAAGLIVTPSPGAVSVRFESSQTALMKDGNYVYDLELTAPNGDIERACEGKVVVTPQVTRN